MTTASELTLVSHHLCPYAQRAVIVLEETRVPYQRVDIDLSNKPEWFLKVSPLGKTPVLLVDNQPIFESSVICEYLDETSPSRMHVGDAVMRAQHRGWMEFGSSTLSAIGAMYSAPDESTLSTKVEDLRRKFEQVETELGNASRCGPYFAGKSFGMVDAAFAPAFRYFDVFDTIADYGIFTATPKVNDWRRALKTRASVTKAVSADYPMYLRRFLMQRGSALSRRMTETGSSN